MFKLNQSPLREVTHFVYVWRDYYYYLPIMINIVFNIGNKRLGIKEK